MRWLVVPMRGERKRDPPDPIQNLPLYVTFELQLFAFDGGSGERLGHPDQRLGIARFLHAEGFGEAQHFALGALGIFVTRMYTGRASITGSGI